MNINNLEFKSTNGIDTIKAIVYAPQENPKGIIQICHGMCEHIERYDDFARFLCQNGYIVCGHDHLGHGKTAPNDNALGFFADNNGWRILVDDTYKLTRIIKKIYPTMPIFLLGHSMGSFISRLCVSYYTYSVNGLILSGTGGPIPAIKGAIMFADAQIKLKGKMYRSAIIDKMAFGDFNKNYQSVKTQKDWISRDNDIVNKYINDPKCSFLFTASAFKDLFTLIANANSTATYERTAKSLPIYMFSGDDDPVGNYGKGVTKVYENYKKFKAKDIELKLYPKGRHEMLNEINRNEVYSDILNWLENHNKSSLKQ